MPVTPSRRSLPVPELAAVAVATLLVLAATVGPLPPSVAVALSAATACVVATVRLARPFRRRPGVPRRAAVSLAAAVLTAGLTVAVPAVAAADRAPVATVGLAASCLLHAVALVLLPGRVRLPAPARLREVVDGAGLATSLVFAGWAVLPAGHAPLVARTAVLLGAAGLGAIIATAVTEWPRRPGPAICRIGAATTLTGLAAQVVLLAHRPPAVATLLVVPPVVLGTLLTAAGARRAARAVPARHVSALNWPRATVPAVIAILAAGWHFRAAGALDPAAVLLGLTVIPPLVLRELLTAADHRRSVNRLAAGEARFRSLVSGSDDLILLLDDALRVHWQSPAAHRLFGLHDADLLGRPFGELLHPDDAPRAADLLDAVRAGSWATPLAARMRDGHGRWRDVEATVRDQRDVPEVTALVVYVRDVGGRRRQECTVQQFAATDPFTGVADRRELARTLAARPAGRPGALLVVDLHGTAGTDDARGRTTGDDVLAEAARRLRAAAGPDDLVARLGGDEFAVVAEGGPVLAYALATRLLGLVGEPYALPGSVVRPQVSIGLAEITEEGTGDVLRQADLARRRAGQLGRNRVEWYDAHLEEQLVRRLDLERELPGAVARGELDLVYQPVLGLADRLPVGTEALLRWRSPVLGTVLPAELLPVADDLGLTGELGRWVLDRACRQLAAWSSGGRELWMAVNVTPTELLDVEFVSRTAATLAGYGVPPERLVVEVADPRIGADLPTVVTRLAGLRSLGVRTALDDFHAAHASLARLRRLPVDLLKVDPRPSPGDEDGPLLEVVASLGRRLGLEIVAEELESTARIEQAREAGCRYGQGFALSRPATAERVEAYLEESRAPSR